MPGLEGDPLGVLDVLLRRAVDGIAPNVGMHRDAAGDDLVIVGHVGLDERRVASAIAGEQAVAAAVDRDVSQAEYRRIGHRAALG